MTSFNHLLIDGDLLVYRTAFAFQGRSLSLAKGAVDSTIFGIADTLDCHDGTIFLTGSRQFRKVLDPSYKENRKGAVRPEHGAAIRDYLITDYGAISLPIIEADDGLGILQGYATRMGYPNATCIVTTDKDLDQVPGWHYNFNLRKLYWVTSDEGRRSLRLQLLTGDNADNIKGLRGIGPKRAAKLLTEGVNIEEVYKEHCLNYETNLQLLTILTSPTLPDYVQEYSGKELYQSLKIILDSCTESLIPRQEESTSDESSTGSQEKIKE